MHDQHVSRRQIDEQILCAPRQFFPRAPPEPLHEIVRQRPAQVPATRLDRHKASALHDRYKAAANSFDFRQFRHDSSGTDIASPPGPRYGSARSASVGMPSRDEASYFGFQRVTLDNKQALAGALFAMWGGRYA